MEAYWSCRPRQSSTHSTPDDDRNSATTSNNSIGSDYDRYRQTLVANNDKGWAAELRCYLKDMPADVTKETDIIEWWQVSHMHLKIDLCTHHLTQNHSQLYPTLAHIALDILLCQASSVPCERLFSSSKQVADDRRARLGPTKFEELQLMKFSWRNDIHNLATWNSGQIEEINLDEYRELLALDELGNECDEEVDEFVLQD